MGNIMDVELIIEGFVEKYPILRLPQSWIRALGEEYDVSYGDILNASRRVRRRMRIQKIASSTRGKKDIWASRLSRRL